MKVHFYLRYNTQFGQNIRALVTTPKGETAVSMRYLNDSYWYGEWESAAADLHYRYECIHADGAVKADWERERKLSLNGIKQSEIRLFDTWNPAGALENAFETQPFREIFLRRNDTTKAAKKSAYTHIFRVKAPLLRPNECLCLLGHGNALRNWDSAAPLLMNNENQWWTLRVDLSKEDFPLAYKYGVWDTEANRFLGFENETNRTLYHEASANALTVLHDGFARLPIPAWRGAGVAIPVFSLRSENGFGVGEFTDLPALADWSANIGLKVIQLLPINDTSATGLFTDCYPYAAISAFALHPLYINVEEVAGKKHAAALKPYAKQKKTLNALPAVDYVAVMEAKWNMLRALFALQKSDFLNDPAYLEYFDANKHWLAPYAAFCFLKEKYKTPDFNQWPEARQFTQAELERLTAPDAPEFDAVALHYFVQWQLHLQLQNAVAYVHSKGLALKGDIPIGIYRYSCDAWVAPELYNMDMQAGAPPDDFAVNGQNWGFPTYNWARMQADGFAWWKQRFAQMSLYFDAFRIDHILGFFRIWSIPLDAVQGILGYFVPAIPVTERELHEAGIGFHYERLCMPYLTEHILWETFGENAAAVKKQFLTASDNGAFRFKPAFDTQIKVAKWFADGKDTPERQKLRDSLYNLLANRILIQPIHGENGAYHFRIGMENTASFRALDPQIQGKLKALYLDYFFNRQDDFWQIQAMEKLPALKRATNMLICGEDLGMVPGCVPDVMQELGLLSLEIQRMPKKTGSEFFHPKDAPYLSVVTPSTHDMSTIRGWWEESQPATQRFFNQILGQWGKAPFFCEPWINRMVVEQHFHSPAMWSIFQLQDLLGIDGAIRRENPADERINIPADPKHYWRYRMHLSLRELNEAQGFNGMLKQLVEESGRA